MRHLVVACSLVGAALVAGTLSSCAPGTPDKDSWRTDAVRAVGSVESSVGTMQAALAHHDRIYYPYLRVVAVNAEEGASTAAGRLASRQPPSAYRQRYDDTTSALDDAETLLSDARIAVVAHDAAGFPGLLRQLASTADELQRLEDGLRAVPDDWTRP